MLYLYALLGSRPRAIPDATMCGERLRVVVCGRLFAAAGEINARPPVEEQNLRGHEQMVRKLAENVAAILPARFGSVFADEAALARLVAEREAELLRALDLVTDREQMTLRVYGEEIATPATRNCEEIPSGAAYLLAKKRARDQDNVAIGLDEIHSRLAAFVRAQRTERQPQCRSGMIASIFHLIDRGMSGPYTEALKQVAIANLRFTVSGPWPPYAFGPQGAF